MTEIRFQPDDKLIDRRQAAEVLGISKWKLWRLEVDGRGPPILRLSEKRAFYIERLVREWAEEHITYQPRVA